jgi:3-hydroxybutyryl-CoA dehydrogenase
MTPPDHRATEKIPASVAQQLMELAARARPGRNLARALAEHGVTVTIVDRKLTLAEEALRAIGERLEQRVESGLLPARVQGEVLSRLRIGSGADRLRGQDLVIEAGGAERQARIEALRLLDRAVEPGTPMAALVQGIHGYDLTDLAPDPSRIVPIHLVLADFQTTIVEVVQAAGVSREAIVKVARVLEQSGLSVVQAPGAPGFLVDRLVLAMINEAVRMLDRGEAGIDEIDRVIRVGTIHDVGPLQLADLVGLDYVFDLCNALVSATGEARYAPSPLLRAYVENGHLGLKSGRGFYTW